MGRSRARNASGPTLVTQPVKENDGAVVLSLRGSVAKPYVAKPTRNMPVAGAQETDLWLELDRGRHDDPVEQWRQTSCKTG